MAEQRRCQRVSRRSGRLTPDRFMVLRLATVPVRESRRHGGELRSPGRWRHDLDLIAESLHPPPEFERVAQGGAEEDPPVCLRNELLVSRERSFAQVHRRLALEEEFGANGSAPEGIRKELLVLHIAAQGKSLGAAG